MAVYTIIAGVDGVGKTSFLGALSGCTKDIGTVVQDDLRTISNYIRDGVSFVRKSTLDSSIDNQIIQMVVDAGYRIQLCYIAVNTVSDCLERIQNRVRHGGSDVASDIVIHRFNTRWDAFFKILPLCNSADLYDNNNGFAKVAEYKRGHIQATANNAPAWLVELLGLNAP